MPAIPIHAIAATLLLIACATDPLAAQAAATWRPVDLLTHRENYSIAYDEERGRVVLFGGVTQGYSSAWGQTTVMNDTWEWGGTRWVLREPANRPSARVLASMAFDPVRRKVILFGGSTATDGVTAKVLNDLWEWDGRDWKQIATPVAPKPRMGASMATCRTRNRVVLFGGSDRWALIGLVPMGETWEWDGSQWQQKFPANSVDDRALAGLAEDRIAGKLLLYGGWTSAGSGRETWTWDGITWQLVPVASPPSEYADSMCDDPWQGRVILKARRVPYPNVQTLWRWDGTAWIDMFPTQTVHDSSADIVADLGRREILDPFGQDQGKNVTNRFKASTHIYDGTQWRTDGKEPSPWQIFMGMGYDGQADGMLITEVGPAAFAPLQTWRWDEAGIRQLFPATALPYGQAYMGYDPRRKVTYAVVYDSSATGVDTWSWDGSDWKKLGIPTTWGAGGNWAYDSRRATSICANGTGEIHEFDGSAWRTLKPTLPAPARRALAAAFDEVRNRLVMFGGQTSQVNETWEWDGVQWTQRFSAHAPPPLIFCELAYVPYLRSTVLLGYEQNQMQVRTWQSWLWDGTDWQQLSVDAIPKDTNLRAMVYDPGRQRVRAYFVSYYGGPAQYTGMELQVTTHRATPVHPRPGESVRLEIDAPWFGNRLAWLLMSQGAGPGIPALGRPWGTELLPLQADPLLFASASAAWTIPLDANGKGSWTIPVPNDPGLWWLRLHTAALLCGPTAIEGVTTQAHFEIVR